MEDVNELYGQLAAAIRAVVRSEVRLAMPTGGPENPVDAEESTDGLDFDADGFEDADGDASFGESLDVGEEEAYTPYTREELLGLGKDDLLAVAELWGISKTGKADAVIDRIMDAQDVSIATSPAEDASLDDDDGVASADDSSEVDWSEEDEWDWGEDSEDESADELTLEETPDSDDLSLDDFLK